MQEVMQKSGQSKYVPALGFNFLTPCYDTVVGLTGRERTVKQALVKQAGLACGQQVLDLACGTGTLAILIKKHQPGVKLSGIDGDRKVLSIAARKVQKAQVEVRFQQALSFALPYSEAQFDRVLSSMFFHHLAWDDKVRTVREVYRVLKPGAEFHVADWGGAANRLMRGLFLTVQLLDGFISTRDHVAGRMPALFTDNGFSDVAQRQTINTIYGTIALFSATKPAQP